MVIRTEYNLGQKSLNWRQNIFTPLQAKAILEMRLSKLIGLEIMVLNEEYKDILKNIEEFEKIGR